MHDGISEGLPTWVPNRSKEAEAKEHVVQDVKELAGDRQADPGRFASPTSPRRHAIDCAVGTNFAHTMQPAATAAHHTLAVLSPASLRSRFGEAGRRRLTQSLESTPVPPWGAIRPARTSARATRYPKMNPPTWAKNATPPLDPVPNSPKLASIS
jgi:hypothetical protein